MTITVCDRCAKKLDSGNHVTVGNKGLFRTYSLCNSCGKTVLSLIKKLDNKKLDPKANLNR